MAGRERPLEHDQRLIPWRLFVLGGEYDLDNLVAKGSVECMRIRGHIAWKIHDVPDGTRIDLSAGE